MNTKRNILFVFLLLISFLFGADEDEKIFATEEDTYHETELSEQLLKLKEQRIEINYASKKELQLLPWLSNEDINCIIKFRKSHKIQSNKDLFKLGINFVTIEDIQNYISFKVQSNQSFSQISRVEYNEKKDCVSILKYTQKTEYNYNNFRFGFISQKDEGETNAFDYISYFAEYSTGKNKIILGKYRLNIGQGIFFAPKLGMSKSGAATNTPINNKSSLRAYTSTFEMWELEGIAFEKRINFEKRNSLIKILPFYSKTKLDANLKENQITSFDLSGVHLNDEKKDKVEENIFGANIEYQYDNFTLGFTAFQQKFNKDFENKNLNTQNIGYSTDLSLKNNENQFVSEFASVDEKNAFVGIYKWGNRKFRQLVLYRNYDKDFPTWHGKPFSNQANFDNENGVYYGITFLPINKTKINFYVDLWNYPQVRYSEKMRTIGSEQFLQIDYLNQNNQYRLTLHRKDREKFRKIDDIGLIRSIERNVCRFDRWQFFDKNITFKSRIEYVFEYFKDEKIYDKGWLMYQQLKFKNPKIQIISRIAFYKSDILLYMYENNVNGIMQNSIFSDEGVYSFLLVKYHLFDSIELQSKISDYWKKENSFRVNFEFIIKM